MRGAGCDVWNSVKQFSGVCSLFHPGGIGGDLRGCGPEVIRIMDAGEQVTVGWKTWEGLRDSPSPPRGEGRGEGGAWDGFGGKRRVRGSRESSPRLPLTLSPGGEGMCAEGEGTYPPM